VSCSCSARLPIHLRRRTHPPRFAGYAPTQAILLVTFAPGRGVLFDAVMSHLSRLRSSWGALRHQHCKYDHNENERRPLDAALRGGLGPAGSTRFNTTDWEFRTAIIDATISLSSARGFFGTVVCL
jgi:hypothetical protein